ncbi:bicaudal D-related protein homolog isoform X3 [Tachypleus tridentatus]|uniref:bicaudal D-related protein homolog isoform X3 n=1 Tax=Tachypleus tridentatus TaxID=6853 RepID=UPI003FD35DD4
MCACRLEEMQQTPPNYHILHGDLEEYIKEMENRIKNTSGSNDIYADLAQKEQDLILAAQLGKALLEKNEELSLFNEKLTENFSKKLELLEQEKHGLKRKLDSVEGEYDSRVAELLADIAELKNELEGHEVSLKLTEREKRKLIQELQEQNHKLSIALRQANKSEEYLTGQLKVLRQQFTVRCSNFTDHVSQLEGLREEIDILLKRKYDLEQRVESLGEERENLSLTLEESGDRITMLECNNKEQEQRIRKQQRDIEELKHVNAHLQAKIDNVLKRCSSPSFKQTSIYNEIEMSSHSFAEDELNGSQLRKELSEIYHQIKQLCEDLRSRRDSLSMDSGIQSSPDEVEAHNMHVGMLTAVLKELQTLMHDFFTNYSGTPCSSCQTVSCERDLLDKLQKELKDKTNDLKKKEQSVLELTKMVAIYEREIDVLKIERNQLRDDIGNSKIAKDEIVKKAWEVRDGAVGRKNAVEIQLAKTRIDMMHINSQLMEAVQQKVELSQQLEQWQVDMQILLDEQLKTKLRNHEQEDKKKILKPQKPAVNNKGKLFKLWR